MEKIELKVPALGWDVLIRENTIHYVKYYKKKILVVLKGNNSSRVLSENVGRLHLE